MIKKVISAFAAAALLLTCLPFGISASAVGTGDLNGDGCTDICDVVLLQDYAEQGLYIADGDLNEDNLCDEGDVEILKAMVMGTNMEITDNVAYGKQVSTVPQSENPALLADGNGLTGVQAEGSAQFCVELGDLYDISGVEVFWGDNGFAQQSCPSGYSVAVKSSLGGEWINVASADSVTYGTNTLSFDSVPAYAVRITANSQGDFWVGDIGAYATRLNYPDLVSTGYTVDATADIQFEPGTVIDLETLQDMQRDAKESFLQKLENREESVMFFLGDSAFCGDVYYDDDKNNNNPSTADTIPYFTTYYFNELSGCHESGYTGENIFTYINEPYFGRKVLNIYNASIYNEAADVTVIHAGFNDANPEDPTHVEEFAQDLAKLLMREIARGSYVVYMKPMDTLYDQSCGYYESVGNAMGMFAARTRAYAEIAEQVCLAVGVDVFDTPGAQVGTLYAEETMDTMHPSANARAVVSNRLAAFIASGGLDKKIYGGETLSPTSDKIKLFYNSGARISGGKLILDPGCTVFLIADFGEENLCLYPRFSSAGETVVCIPPQEYAPRINDPASLEGIDGPVSFAPHTVITSAQELYAQYGQNGLLEGNFIANSQDGTCIVGIFSTGGCVIENFEFVSYQSLKNKI